MCTAAPARTLLFLLIFLTTVARAEDVIRISTGEYLPDYSQSYKHFGLVPHIVTQSFAHEDFTVDWSFYPWARSKLLAQEVQRDATCCWARTAEREAEFLFSNPVLDRQYVLFHLKSYDLDWDTLEDLRGIKIGATISYSYGAEFNKAEKSGELIVERVATDEQNFRKLVAGRIKIFALLKKTGYKTIEKFLTKEQASLITHHPKPFHSYQNHLIISRAHPHGLELIETFNRGLKKLKDKGDFDRFHLEAERGDYLNK